MQTKQLIRASKRLSWLLRHGANETGISMDAAGWVQVAEVLPLVRLSRQALDVVVQTNNKSRLQLEGGRIRATQGHSLSGTPVTVEALEGSWAVWDGDGSLWHSTHQDAIHEIARHGLLPQSRTHVHLADSTDSRVGKRANVGVTLEVCPRRVRATEHTIFRSPNGVILVRHVLPGCVIGVQALTRRAKSSIAVMRSAFGLPVE